MAEEKLLEESSLTPNSHKYKSEKLQPVAKGTVTRERETLGKKLMATFIKDDAQSVGEYLMFDVLIPAAKNAFSDLVTTGVNMLLFGENRAPSSVKRSGDRSYVSYNNYYRGSAYSNNLIETREYQPRSSQRSTPSPREVRKFDQVEVPSRKEAEDVLNAMVDRTIMYGMASVADLYDLAGVPSVYTDNDWGWDSLQGSRIERSRHGYVIRVPQPHLLEE